MNCIFGFYLLKFLYIRLIKETIMFGNILFVSRTRSLRSARDVWDEYITIYLCAKNIL